MKKSLLLALFLIFSLCLPHTIIAEDISGDVPGTESDGEQQIMTDTIRISDEMVNVLVKEIQTLFPIMSQRDYFTEPRPDVFSDDDENTVIRIGTDRGKRSIVLYTNTDTVCDHNGFSTIDTAYPTDFQLSLDVTVNDAYPSNLASCFVGFTDYGVSAFTQEQDPVMVTLFTTGLGHEIYARHHYSDTGNRYPVNTSKRTTSKLTVIHLRRHTYVFVDGVYSGQFHDGKSGPFRLIYGATVLANGEDADCSFDNMMIKKVSLQR